MNKDIKDVMDDILEGIRKMTPDEFRRDVLCLNGQMTFTLFNKVMKEVIRKGVIDDDHLAYFPERFEITETEFRDVFHYLEKDLKNYLHDMEDGSFPNTIAYFKFQDELFRWDLLIGQGSATYLVHEKGVIDFNEYDYKTIREIDKSIRFYKRLKG